MVCHNALSGMTQEQHQEMVRKQIAEHKASVLRMFDQGCTPASMYVMGMLSDAQEAMSMGMMDVAMTTLNDAKIIISERLTTRDPQGRHDFNEIEKPFRKRG